MSADPFGDDRPLLDQLLDHVAAGVSPMTDRTPPTDPRALTAEEEGVIRQAHRFAMDHRKQSCATCRLLATLAAARSAAPTGREGTTTTPQSHTTGTLGNSGPVATGFRQSSLPPDADTSDTGEGSRNSQGPDSPDDAAIASYLSVSGRYTPRSETAPPDLAAARKAIEALPRWDKRSVPGGFHVRLSDVLNILATLTPTEREWEVAETTDEATGEYVRYTRRRSPTEREAPLPQWCGYLLGHVNAPGWAGRGPTPCVLRPGHDGSHEPWHRALAAKEPRT